MKLKKHEKYEIFWVDTYWYGSWYTEEQIDEKTYNHLDRTVGFFIKETKNFIILCMSLEEHNDFAPYGFPKWIPKGFIRKIKHLK